MDSTHYRAVQKILGTRFGQFYYRAKSDYVDWWKKGGYKAELNKGIEAYCGNLDELAKRKLFELVERDLRFQKPIPKENPKPEDLSIIIPDLGFEFVIDLGSLSDFIDWFNKEHGEKSELRFRKLIKRIEKLCKSKEDGVDFVGCYEITGSTLSLLPMIKSEMHLKRHYQKLVKAESQKHDREKKRVLKRCDKFIAEGKQLYPAFDEEHFRSMVQEKVENIQPASTLQDIRYRQKYGLRWGFSHGYQDDWSDMIRALCQDQERNGLIVADILQETADPGAKAVVISERIGHLEDLRERIEAAYSEAEIITGEIREAKREEIFRRFDRGKLAIILVTLKSIHTLEVKRANRLFVTSPLKYGDHLTQIVGKLLGTARENRGPRSLIIGMSRSC